MPTPKGELSKKNIEKLKAYYKKNGVNIKSGSKKPKLHR